MLFRSRSKPTHAWGPRPTDMIGQGNVGANRIDSSQHLPIAPLSTLPSCETSATRKSLLYCIPSPRLKPLSLRYYQLKFSIFTPCSRDPRSLPRPHTIYYRDSSDIATQSHCKAPPSNFYPAASDASLCTSSPLQTIDYPTWRSLNVPPCLFS